MNSTNKNTSTKSLTSQGDWGESLSGTFTVVAIGRGKTKTSIPWCLRLKGLNGDLFEACPQRCSLELPEGLSPNDRVFITAQEAEFHGKRIVEIVSIQRVSCSPKHLPTAVFSMVCPLQGGIAALQALVARLTILPLQQFVVDVLSDIETATAFLSRPASFSFHHSEPGGLLRHSLDVANIVWSLPGLSEVDREIALVGALFHDLGKIRTYAEGRSMTTVGRLVGHDQLTLEICASALKNLDRRWAEGSAILRHVWTCASPGARYGMASKSVAADAVRFADGFSATVANHELALESGHPSGEFIELGRQQFYDLQPPLAA